MPHTPRLLLAAALMAAAAPMPAAHKMALNLVWTRIADVNGEYGSIESAEFSPDGRFVVSGSKFDNSVIMWRASDGTELWRAYTEAEIERVGWSRDNKVVAAVSEDRMVTIFDARTGAVTRTLPQRTGLDALTWSRDGRWLAIGEEEVKGPGGKVSGKAILYRWPDAVVDREVDYGGTINELVFSSDDKLLFVAGHGGILRAYSTADMKLVREYVADTNYHLVNVDISPDDKYVACSGFGGSIYIFDVATGNRVKRFNQTGRKVETLAWSRDGQYLLSAGHDPSIFVTRLKDILETKGSEVHPFYLSPPTDNMEYIHFSPNGAFLTSAHQDGCVRVWVFMNDDPHVNERRHEWVKQQQKKYDTPAR